MVFIETKPTHLLSVKAADRYCATCKKSNTIVLNIFRTQLHFFGIPLVPIGKTGNALCEHCERVLEEANMSEFIQHDYNIVKNRTKKPNQKWLIAMGLLLVILATALLNNNTNQTELAFLAQPLKGDVYEYKISDSRYSSMKISTVSTDSVAVLFNTLTIDKASRIHRIDRLENYKSAAVTLERQKINDMFNNGLILKINRSANAVD